LSAVVTGSFDLSGEVPASLPSIPATSHKLIILICGIDFLAFQIIRSLSLEVAPVTFTDAVVGDFGDPYFHGTYCFIFSNIAVVLFSCFF
jgi:hypothetical protein